MIGILSYKGWMLEPLFAQRAATIIMRSIKNGTFEGFVKAQKDSNQNSISSFYAGLEAEGNYPMRGDEPFPAWYSVTAKNGLKVAIVPMIGAITKNGDACSWGWRDYQNVISRIERNTSVSAILFHFNNTPGGSHDGTPEMASIISKLTKTSLGFGDGYVASAHYYAMSQTDHIMLNKETPTEVGSIGSLIVWENVQNMIAKGELPEMEIIRAPQSVDKALLNPLEPLTDELRAQLNEDLRSAVKVFISDVKKGRGDKLTKEENVFTGKMYSTSDAIRFGLADSKGNLLDAINKAAELAAAKSKSTSGTSQSQSNNTMSYPKLSALFSGEAWKKVAAIFAEDEAALVATEKKVADQEAELVQLNADKKTQDAKVTELTNTVSGLTAQVTTLQGEKSTLETEKKDLQSKLDKKPAGAATTVVSEQDPDPSVKIQVVNSWDKKAQKKVGKTKEA